MEQRFKSKVDRWLLLVIAAPMVIVAVVIGVTATRLSHLSAVMLAMLVVPLVLGVALPVWIFLGTSYTVDRDALTVRCGPITQVIPVRSITRIVNSRSIESAPALSLDRLTIEYGTGRRVVISPEDKPRFLEALARAGTGVTSESLRGRSPSVDSLIATLRAFAGVANRTARKRKRRSA